MSGSREDWDAVVRGIQSGERRALLRLTRVVTACLQRLGAYDFRDEWDDVAQDAVIIIVQAYAEGKIRDPKAIPAFARTVVRRKFYRLINAVRPVDDEEAIENAATSPDGEIVSAEMRQLIERLPEKQRLVIELVYFQGETLQRAARLSGIPLSTLKRYQGLALARLKTGLSPGSPRMWSDSDDEEH